MKIIITENRLNEMINKFIGDFVNESYTRLEQGIYLVYEELDEKENDYDDDEYDPVILFHTSNNGRLYIKNTFLKIISGMFGLSLPEAMGRIKDWFENENGVKVKFTESDNVPRQNYNNEDEDNNN